MYILDLGNELLQCEFINELRNHRYAVDGISRKNNVDRHTWNRVYHDGAWWNVDITTDNTRTANGKELYGFRKLEDAFVPDKDFFIMKIY